MLDQFHIRPWEITEDHEIYKEDLANMIALKHIQNEAETNRMQKSAWKAEMANK